MQAATPDCTSLVAHPQGLQLQSPTRQKQHPCALKHARRMCHLQPAAEHILHHHPRMTCSRQAALWSDPGRWRPLCVAAIPASFRKSGCHCRRCSLHLNPQQIRQTKVLSCAGVLHVLDQELDHRGSRLRCQCLSVDAAAVAVAKTLPDRATEGCTAASKAHPLDPNTVLSPTKACSTPRPLRPVRHLCSRGRWSQRCRSLLCAAAASGALSSCRRHIRSGQSPCPLCAAATGVGGRDAQACLEACHPEPGARSSMRRSLRSCRMR
mmetsp:Transcript_68810/g.165174  ORF Transcript_68810/g.165174 Transcript_68810/m.165174 type:complete len:266 (+) Transcript_68810:266-1063(+)